MPSYERELDLVQGYNFKKDVQKPIGFITALTLGKSNVLPADQMVSSPMVDKTGVATTDTGQAQETVGALKVVSVLKKIKWDLGDVDPIEFEGTLSVTGKQMLMGMLYATLIDINVSVSYCIYEYDPLACIYFAAYANSMVGTSDAGMKSGKGALGMIKKDGANLALTVSPSPSEEVQSPENYNFTLQIVPQPIQQTLYLASASNRKVTKSWGRTGPKTST
jgi:hypothetical protein